MYRSTQDRASFEWFQWKLGVADEGVDVDEDASQGAEAEGAKASTHASQGTVGEEDALENVQWQRGDIQSMFQRGQNLRQLREEMARELLHLAPTLQEMQHVVAPYLMFRHWSNSFVR